MRVLMTCQPAFSHGTQLIPVARELELRGHQVRVATSATFATTLRGYGLDACAFGPDWMLRPGDALFDRTVGPHSFFGFPDVVDSAAVEELTAAAADFDPDLMVRDYSEFTGWAVARKRAVPLVTQGIIHRLPPPAEDRVVEGVARIARLAGVEPPAHGEELLGWAYLDIVPPSFRCPWEHHAPRARPCRPSSFDGSTSDTSDEPPAWLGSLGADRPAVYVTLGTVFAEEPLVWQAVLAAVGSLDVDTLVTTGSVGPIDLGPVPSNVRVEAYVPQSQVLPRCRAVICHAGYNTMIGAFWHGLPTVCVPLSADQPINAARCADAGAGINTANAPAIDPRGPLVDPSTLSHQAIAAAVRTILDDPSFAAAASRLGEEIRAMPGPGATAVALEQLAVGCGVEPRC